MLGWVLMECHWHRNRDETGICKSCGRAACETCIGDDGLLLIGEQYYDNEAVLADERCPVSGSDNVPDAIREWRLAEEPLKITQYKLNDVEKVTCLVCDEPLEPGVTQYCKSCQDLIKYGL